MTGPRPEVCVGAVAVAGDRLLLVRRAQEPGRGLWSVPGGRVEAGETLADAVVRELAEETGVAGTCGPLLGVAERRDGAHHFVILDYMVVAEGERPVPGTDVDDAAWVPLSAVQDLPLVPGLFRFLAEHGVLEG
jgi:ADP-ribose pyrophosphatase YjhB (NUDIX family)